MTAISAKCGNMMSAQRAEDLLAEYKLHLDREGIDDRKAVAALRIDNGFVVVQGKEQARFVTERDMSLKHPALYESLTGARVAAVFAQPKYCIVAAECGKPVPPILDDMAQIVGPKARICEATDTKEIVRILKKDNACLIRGREQGLSGALCIGSTLDQAFAALLILEKTAQALIEGEYIGGARPLGGVLARLMHKVYDSQYAKKDEQSVSQTARDIPRVIPEEELALRREIIACGVRLNEENLVQYTWGNISARLDERYMLITPTGMIYTRLEPYDIVRVDMGTL